MKIIFCTLIVAGLVWPMRLHAQDAPSRPLKDPGLEIEPTPLPKSSVRPTAVAIPQPTPPQLGLPSPKATPSVTPQASPPPTPTATPERSQAAVEETPAEQTATPSPAKRRARAARKRSPQPPEPTPQPSPLSRGEMRAIAEKLKDMEKEWEASFNDPAVIEKSLADDFVGTSPAGETMTKKALIKEAKENPAPPPKTITRDVDVVFHGPTLAIVTGAAKQITRNRSGQIVEYNYRFTDTWIERDGEWRCFASQSMLVPR